MSFRIASRFAMRELRGGLRGFRVFLACLALGVAAIAQPKVAADDPENSWVLHRVDFISWRSLRGRE